MSERPKTSVAAPEPAGPPGAAGGDEFAHVRSPRARHPALALGAALLAFFLVFHIRHDVRYALSSTAALDLGDAGVTFSPRVHVSDLENRYVRVRGTPDRESALELDTKGSWVFTQFFRILGTGGRLYVHRRESPLPAFRAEQDVFEGRLVRFSDLSFEDAIRGYFSAHVTATHFFAPEELARALAARAAGAMSLRDRTGDVVEVRPDDLVGLDVVRPDEVRLGLPRDRFATEAAARAAIAAHGGEVLSWAGLVQAEPPASAPSAGPLSVVGGALPLERWVLVARFPAATRDAALSALGELDRKVEIRDARETIKARSADISPAPGALVVRAAPAAAAAAGTAATAPAERRLPLVTIAAARTLATVRIPADAYLLIETDHPRDHLATLFIALALVMFGAVNVVALVRELRR